MPKFNQLVLDNALPFSNYIADCRALIENRRLQSHAQKNSLLPANFAQIMEANSPYELYPTQPIYLHNRLKYGVLLIHGLLDCPFSLKDIGLHLQQQGMLVRAVLLPGHGTVPSDLLDVSYQDWIETVRYGVETLKKEVDQIFLIGYSTGAALSIYHALQDPLIAGIILLSPAIKIKVPVHLVMGWEQGLKWISRSKNQWFCREKEIDYAKYRSIPFNAVNQVTKLTRVIQQLNKTKPLETPLFIAISREDETVSSKSALQFFANLSNQQNRLLLYTANAFQTTDSRIIIRQATYPDLNIKHLSHVALPFSPTNQHYGEKGDFLLNKNKDLCLHGAYNRIERKIYAFLYQIGLAKKIRCELTYNPDFSFMADNISQFIL